MKTVRAHCKECDYEFAEKYTPEEDNGAPIERVASVAQVHADHRKHKVEYERDGFATRIVGPRTNSPSVRNADDDQVLTLALNPLNDSFV